jgi:NAD(P)-dependent dehydrogenase (short-subunit alcohol dehydrogenase family)
MANKTVLLTGSSTGIGRAAAMYFHKQGWNVAASMRTPAKETELTKLPGVICPALDVTKPETIQSAVAETLRQFGSIDVLVNNAGYGLTGPFEGITDDQVQRQFETNVFGLMRVTRALLPHFRSKQSGVVVNISSMGGRITFPFYSLYHGTKWAVEGFTESLRYEVEPFGIRLKLIEPGAIKTDFYGRSNDSSLPNAPPAYQAATEIAFTNMNKAGANGSLPEEVAAVIFRAATDGSRKLRYPIGKNARPLLLVRRLISDALFASLVKSEVFKPLKK